MPRPLSSATSVPALGVPPSRTPDLTTAHSDVRATLHGDDRLVEPVHPG
jgi:hypothetical protein